MDNDLPTERQAAGFLMRWGIGIFIVLTILGVVSYGVSGISHTVIERRVVESSRQYAETNTAAFYDRLETVRKIDAQLAGLEVGDPMIPALHSQKTLLENEMRRLVAKIPSDSQTSEMNNY